MKNGKRTAARLLLVLMCLSVLVLPAAATSMVHNGLQVTMETDKEQYDAGEPITATITVLNTNPQSVTIASLEQLIPEGYVLAEGSAALTENVELGPNQSMMMNVTFVGEAPEESAMEADFFTKLIEGQTWGIPNLLLIVLAVIVVVIFMVLT